MAVETAKITLELITPALASRIVVRDEQPADRWHPEYPFVDELDPLRSLAIVPAGESDPVFSLYLIRRRQDGLAVGGIGFFGPPDADGTVELGYGLVPGARGAGLATDAVLAALAHARRHGALRVVADTEELNRASQRVLLKAGFREIRREGSVVHFEWIFSS